MSEFRKCFREPIPEIFSASQLLNDAINDHSGGNYKRAEQLIIEADIPLISEWAESILGKESPYVNVIQEDLTIPRIPREKRKEQRMPNRAEKEMIITRDGHHCIFCGIPVIRPEVRDVIRKKYSHAVRWGKKNIERHSAFFAMWLQYDHIVPHSRGGNNDISNIVITCAPCNYGRMDYLLHEVGLENPSLRKKEKSDWDGLERIVI